MGIVNTHKLKEVAHLTLTWLFHLPILSQCLDTNQTNFGNSHELHYEMKLKCIDSQKKLNIRFKKANLSKILT